MNSVLMKVNDLSVRRLNINKYILLPRDTRAPVSVSVQLFSGGGPSSEPSDRGCDSVSVGYQAVSQPLGCQSAGLNRTRCNRSDLTEELQQR